MSDYAGRRRRPLTRWQQVAALESVLPIAFVGAVVSRASVTSGVGDGTYEIDLNDKDAANLEKPLAPVTEAGLRVGERATARGKMFSGRSSVAEMSEWAPPTDTTSRRAIGSPLGLPGLRRRALKAVQPRCQSEQAAFGMRERDAPVDLTRLDAPHA